jgi:hypothetical protein
VPPPHWPNCCAGVGLDILPSPHTTVVGSITDRKVIEEADSAGVRSLAFTSSTSAFGRFTPFAELSAGQATEIESDADRPIGGETTVVCTRRRN